MTTHYWLKTIERHPELAAPINILNRYKDMSDTMFDGSAGVTFRGAAQTIAQKIHHEDEGLQMLIYIVIGDYMTASPYYTKAKQYLWDAAYPNISTIISVDVIAECSSGSGLGFVQFTILYAIQQWLEIAQEWSIRFREPISHINKERMNTMSLNITSLIGNYSDWSEFEDGLDAVPDITDLHTPVYNDSFWELINATVRDWETMSPSGTLFDLEMYAEMLMTQNLFALTSQLPINDQNKDYWDWQLLNMRNKLKEVVDQYNLQATASNLMILYGSHQGFTPSNVVEAIALATT